MVHVVTRWWKDSGFSEVSNCMLSPNITSTGRETAAERTVWVKYGALLEQTDASECHCSSSSNCLLKLLTHFWKKRARTWANSITSVLAALVFLFKEG